MKIFSYLNRTLFIMVIAAALSCSNDDDDNSPQLEVWKIQVETAKSATSQYFNFEDATNNGLIDVSGYVPNMGHPHLNPILADGTSELDKQKSFYHVWTILENPDGVFASFNSEIGDQANL